MVCDKVVCVCECVCVCELLCVKLLYVKFVCVKLWNVRDGMWQSYVCVSVCEVIVC